MPLVFAHDHDELWKLARAAVEPGDGGHVVFSGTVRNFNKSKAVSHLFYEAYEALAIAQFAQLERCARERFGMSSAVGAHRLGRTEVGEAAVVIKASAPHRDEAFRAARFLIDELKKTVAIWKQEHYQDGTSTWDPGLCQCSESYEAAGDPALGPLKKALVAQGLDLEVLRQRRVLLVGGGGLGCPLAINLAALGIGHVTLFDGDAVESSNLARQFIFSREHVGHNKALIIQRFVAERFFWVHMQAYPEFLSAQRARALIEDFDLVIDGSDCMATKIMLGEISRQAQVAYICASVYGGEGEVAFFDPRAQGGCFSCWRQNKNQPATCSMSGVLTHACTMVAAHATSQALALLAEPAALRQNQLLIIDTHTGLHRKMILSRDAQCSSCGTRPEPELLRIIRNTA